ncbi:hypothetical protein MY8738_006446 [Beauveria namnaoensis]
MSPTDFEIFVSEFDKRDDCVVVTFCDGTAETYDMHIGADGQDATHPKHKQAIKFTWAPAAHEKELDSVRAKDVDAQKAFFGTLFQNAGLRAEELIEVHTQGDRLLRLVDIAKLWAGAAAQGFRGKKVSSVRGYCAGYSENGDVRAVV